MSFWGGGSWQTNPGLAPGLQGIQGEFDALGNQKSKGVKYANSILKGLQSGDTSAIGNPFLAQLGAQNRMVDANMDPLLPPELAEARAGLQKSRNQEQAGMNFENYVRGSAQDAAHLSEQGRQFNRGTQAQLGNNILQGNLQGHQYVQQPGWGSSLLGALFGGAGAAGGLGWKPFG